MLSIFCSALQVQVGTGEAGRAAKRQRTHLPAFTPLCTPHGLLQITKCVVIRVRRGVHLLPEDCWRIWPTKSPTLLLPSDFSVVFSFLARHLQPLGVPSPSERMALLGVANSGSRLPDPAKQKKDSGHTSPIVAHTSASLSASGRRSLGSDVTVLEEPSPSVSPGKHSRASSTVPSAAAQPSVQQPAPLLRSRTTSNAAASFLEDIRVGAKASRVDAALPRGRRLSKTVYGASVRRLPQPQRHAAESADAHRVCIDQGSDGVFTFALSEV